MSCGKTSASPAAGSSDSLERDIEPLLLGARAVIGEVEALLDQRIDIDEPVLARALARVQQHVLDDRIGALAVLHDLVEIAAQHSGQLVDLPARLVVDRQAFQRVLQLVDQLARDRREIIDEIERVLDLVRDAGGELAERGELLRLHQAILRGAQVLERRGSSRVRACTSSNRRTFSIAITAWSAKVVTSSICLVGERPDVLRVSSSTPIGITLAQHRHGRGRCDSRQPSASRCMVYSGRP